MFCGGGSAGHVIPNIALIEELKKNYRIYYAGTGAIEKDICAKNGVEFHEFEAVKLVRGKILCNLSIPLKFFKSVRAAGEIIDGVKPDLLFCKGGYVCIPPAFAAHRRDIPVITHESDLSCGLANRIIAHKCVRVLTAFPETAQKFRRGVYAGTPMRSSLFNRDREVCRRKFGLDNRPTVIVFGGGSGSKKINGAVREAVRSLCKDFNILHICGKGNVPFTNIGGYTPLGFADDMGAVYACADGAVARCGSNSANELIALKIPTLFIPLDNGASRGDQIKNAAYFKERGLCRVLAEKDLTPETLTEGIYGLLADEKLKAALGRCNVGSGNKNIIGHIESVLGGRSEQSLD